MTRPEDPTAPEPVPGDGGAHAAGDAARDARAADADPYADPYEDLPREPYTLRRFLRELAIAVAILAIGLPLVLLATRGGDEPPEQLASEPVGTAPVPASPSASASSPPSGPPAAAVTAEDRPVLIVAGASLLTDAQRVVDLLGHGGQALTSPDAGFATGMPSLTSLIAETDFDPEHDAVVVQGGSADADVPAERLELAAEQLADRIRGKFSPSTSIVYVGPIPGSLPEGRLEEVRDVLRAAARDKSVSFLDPVELGWSLDDPDLAQQVSEVVAPFLDRS